MTNYTPTDPDALLAQARKDIGSTEISAWTARSFVIGLLAALLGVPLADGGRLLEDVRRFVGDVRAVGGASGLVAANHSLLNAIGSFERGLEERSTVHEALLPAMQLALTRAGGVGNETVVVGRRLWLYLRSGLDYVVGPGFLKVEELERRRRAGESWETPPEPDPRPALLALHRELEARGILLIVVIAPTKAMLHPEGLVDRAPPWQEESSRVDIDALHNPSFAPMRRELEAAGLHLVDPTAAMLQRVRESGRPAFLRADSHWSPSGVDAAAREIADRIHALEPSFEQTPIRLERKTVEHRGVGDLAKALRLPSGALDLEETVRMEVVEPWEGDTAAEILLLGDSFSNIFSDPELGWGRGAGLADQLAHHLSRPVDRLATNGNGAFASREGLAREPGRLVGKKVVIWEVAARELSAGDWRRLELPSRADSR